MCGREKKALGNMRSPARAPPARAANGSAVRPAAPHHVMRHHMCPLESQHAHRLRRDCHLQLTGVPSIDPPPAAPRFVSHEHPCFRFRYQPLYQPHLCWLPPPPKVDAIRVEKHRWDRYRPRDGATSRRHKAISRRHKAISRRHKAISRRHKAISRRHKAISRRHKATSRRHGSIRGGAVNAWSQ